LINSIKRFWQNHPLLVIILIALVPRLIAVIFSKGYGMHDDHFGPIEQPFHIMHDISYWTERTTPHGHSIVYPSIHYVLFTGFEALGIQDPQGKMYLIRLFHALYSLLIVLFGYKIAEVLSNQEIAKKTGFILALFWAFPFLGVRNLIEMVCIPPLMAGFYYAFISKDKLHNAFIAGLCFGLAFVFRYQTLSLSATLGMVLLFKKDGKQLMLFVVGFLLTACVIQGGADIFAWGYPFASFIEYLRYNTIHGNDYTTGPWYNYLLLVLGAFIPPISFFLVFGLFRNWRKTLLILLPVIVFFVLHSYFPNKQERFIFPVVPIILVLGVVGWEEFIHESAFWIRHKYVLKTFWIWFWVINVALLIPFTTYYSKRSRVESMYALYTKPVNGIILVGGKWGVIQPPLFYTGVYPIPIYEIQDDSQIPQVQARISAVHDPPNYAIFFGIENIAERVRNIESSLKVGLTLEKRIDASFLDDIFYRLNPRNNKNQTAFVYKVELK
jgi:hypothetical protein